MGILDQFHKITKWVDPLSHYTLDLTHKTSTGLVRGTSRAMADVLGTNNPLGSLAHHAADMSDKDSHDFGRWLKNSALGAGAVVGGMYAYPALAGGGGAAAGAGEGAVAGGAEGAAAEGAGAAAGGAAEGAGGVGFSSAGDYAAGAGDTGWLTPNLTGAGGSTGQVGAQFGGASGGGLSPLQRQMLSNLLKNSGSMFPQQTPPATYRPMPSGIAQPGVVPNPGRRSIYG